MPKLYVCEKHGQANQYKPFLENGDAIILCPTVVSYIFDYPSELKFKELPYINQAPQYKDNENSYVIDSTSWFEKQYTKLFHSDGYLISPLLLSYFHAKSKEKAELGNESKIESLRFEVELFLGSFDEIIYACDLDHTGTRGFDFLFEKHFGIKDLELFSEQYNSKFSVLLTMAYDENSLKTAIEKRTPFFGNKYIEEYRNQYIRKDFFEYNYNLNSLMLINKAYFLVLNEYPRYCITKNMILALNLINKSKPGNIYKELEYIEVGNPASRQEILIRLMKMSLLDSKDKMNFTITEAGNALLSNLHRKILDPHLGLRLSKDYSDQNISNKDFKDKYSRYLETCLGKQKRLINKIDQ